MDSLGLPLAALVAVLWLAGGLLAALVFGKAAHHADEVERQADPEITAWAAEREERVRRAEFRHAIRHTRQP